MSNGEHVFVTDDGRPLRYREVYPTFQTLVKLAGLVVVSGHRPRLHEIRHTFAVRALETSPTGRQRIGLHMVALATYMGHVNIGATYWYLQTTPDLLREIATASEAFVNGGQL
jgi:integrase